jgi:hypothetical protein
MILNAGYARGIRRSAIRASNPVLRYGLGLALLAAVIGLVVILVSRLAIDRGRCLASHPVAHHVEGYLSCPPTVDYSGAVSLSCHWEDAVDWTETVCDQWEFPHGRAEQDP